ncbi:MAG: SUMF1/EgtB/PvdO family nonheme iron enzyme [Bacteroidales bacterium]|jgi:formylglycine-generating enzyme required for sulfatase activity|nr:SUMF1/EgtB/PvdO family nonheme iron enzyme [Bacteroidales bacterium]MCI1733341.1 SUMF1/EgtB/PvdO family nonheme iron enzyme [Bacteroidales bacterium]
MNKFFLDIRKIGVFLIICISVCLVSCSKSESPSITLNSTSVSMDATNSSMAISFTTNVDWTATSTATWLSVSPSSGTRGSASIKITAEANPDYKTRSATITVTAGSTSQTISVTQAERNGYIVSGNSFSIGKEGGNITIPIQANIDYKCSVSDDAKSWLSVVKTKSLSNYEIVISATKNSSYDSRKGTVTISYGSESTAITITQSQTDELIIDTKEYAIGSSGGELKIPIKTNISYTCTALESAADWIKVKTLQTKGLEDYYLVLTIDANKNYDGRVGQIKVTGAGKESYITVSQSQLDELIITTTEFSVGSDGGVVSIPIQTNASYSTSFLGNASDWLSFNTSGTKGLSQSYVSVKVKGNTGYDGRVGQIKIAGSGKESIVTITQSQLDAIIVAQTSYTVDKEGGSIEIPISSNITWDCSVVGEATSWINASVKQNTKGLSSKSLVLTIAKNESGNDRIGQIHIYGSNKETYITINQVNDAETLTFTVNGVSFEMIRVDGGTFSMGATSEQSSDAYSDEKPVHQVTLSTYYIGKFEVTQKLWNAIMGSNPSNFIGDKLPAEGITWENGQLFVAKLSQLTGRKFSLPTEAQWEYAARGGSKSKGYKYCGGNTLNDVGWYSDNSNGRTHEVGTKLSNELGLYDMSGNVQEWCTDWYGSYSDAPQTNPIGPSSGAYHFHRGGGWANLSSLCRVSYRFIGYADDNLTDNGVRLVLTP